MENPNLNEETHLSELEDSNLNIEDIDNLKNSPIIRLSRLSVGI